MSKGKGGGHPLKWKTPEELETKIQGYFQWAKENEKNITVTGLAWYLNCDKQTLLNYEHSDENGWLKRIDEDTKRRYIDSIKRAKRRIEMEYEESLFNRSKATGAIFTLKNNYGWVDKQVVEQHNKEITVDIVDDDECSSNV